MTLLITLCFSVLPTGCPKKPTFSSTNNGTKGSFFGTPCIWYSVINLRTGFRQFRLVGRRKFLNPAYGRHWISRRVRIVASIPKQTEKDRKGRRRWYPTFYSYSLSHQHSFSWNTFRPIATRNSCGFVCSLTMLNLSKWSPSYICLKILLLTDPV